MISELKTFLRHSNYKQWFLQAIFIIFAVLLSVFTVTVILEKSLVKQALELEADAFIAQYSEDETFPLPRTRNLIGYLKTPNKSSNIPPSLAVLSPGLYPQMDLPDRHKPVPIYIRDFNDNRLYLVFEGANIDRLVGIFGLVPLSILLIVIYTSSWIAYKLTWRAASPLVNIAKDIRKTTGPDDFSLHLSTKNLSGETKELAEALDEYAKRIDVFVERERQFTADVSHELRTPMTVIDAAAQFLAIEKNLSKKGKERVEMIRRACFDVNELTSAFFLLARDQNQMLDDEQTNVAEVVNQEAKKLQSLINKDNVTLAIDVEHHLIVDTHQKALEIIIGNILGNAVKYTENGSINIKVTDNQVLISDTGIGIPEDLIPRLFDRHVRGRGLNQTGEGIGLSIVKRLCDQFKWNIEISNQPTEGILVVLTKS